MTAHQVGQLLLALAAVIALARVLGALAKRIGQPPVIGEIFAGVLIGPTLFGTVVTDHLLPTDIRPALSGLANVGLVLFMFIVGYELDTALVQGRKRVAASVSIGSILLPFGLGTGLAFWLAGNHDVTRVWPFALFIGAAMSVTAFPVLARILTDRGMQRTEVGGLALASAAVDDVVAWTGLAFIVTFAGAGATDWRILLAVPYTLVMFFGVRPLLRRLAAARDRAGRLTPDVLGVILVGLLLSCFVTEYLGVHAIFGAFLFGAVMPRAGAEALRHEILERLEQVSVLLLLPAFFVLSGMKVDLSTMDLRGLLELGLILVVAISGKFLGAYVGARTQKVPARQAGALAALMNTRGLTEIIILTVGLQLGLLDGSLFSMMVVMALVTTVMAGPLLSWIYPRRQVDRDIATAERAALGETENYRVLVAHGHPAVVALAADLASAHPPAEVVLSRLVPYRAPVEVGAGLSGELLDMTRAMGELEALAGPVRDRGLTVPVLARFSADPGRDLAEQVAAIGPDIVLVPGGADRDANVAPTTPGGDARARFPGAGLVVTVTAVPPEDWSSVLVRVADGADGEAALRVGTALAAARSVELAVQVPGRVSRRTSALVTALGCRVLTDLVARRAGRVEVLEHRGGATPASALVLGGDGVQDVHLNVRTGERE
ncbi:cation:proton antiporter [Longispora sp. NPDC051575]|uniref:cation:proton antiporter n=1 Tax=Longispora sp. NPDC051575 TaxID=3154943 RepID=UPI0034334B43